MKKYIVLALFIFTSSAYAAAGPHGVVFRGGRSSPRVVAQEPRGMPYRGTAHVRAGAYGPRPLYHTGAFIYPYGARRAFYPPNLGFGLYAYNGVVPFYAFGAFVLAMDLNNNLYLGSQANPYAPYPYAASDITHMTYNGQSYSIQMIVFNNNGIMQEVWVITNTNSNVVVGTYQTRDLAINRIYEQH